jgi:hypothetical protein
MKDLPEWTLDRQTSCQPRVFLKIEADSTALVNGHAIAHRN